MGFDSETVATIEGLVASLTSTWLDKTCGTITIDLSPFTSTLDDKNCFFCARTLSTVFFVTVGFGLSVTISTWLESI